MADTRWKNIYDKLKEHDIAVYSPGQHTGECTAPYVVVKEAGTIGMTNVSSSQNLYDIMCYMPQDQYSQLRTFVDEVEQIMDELFPMVRPVHYRSPSFLDDSVKAHMISIQYVNYTKNTRR